MDPKSAVGNAADPEQVAKAATKAKLREEKDLDDLKRALETDFCRRLIWRYLEFCGVHELSYQGEKTHETAFLEGHRNVGNKLLTEVLRVNPEAYVKMRVEATTKEQTDG